MVSPFIAVIAEEGETLPDIAKRALGRSTKWVDLAHINRLSPPYRVQPGDLVIIAGPQPLPEDS